MTPFAYARVHSVDAAHEARRLHADARWLAGGTNLIDHLRLGIASTSTLIDISRLPLAQVETLGDGTLRIGALVRNADLAAHPAVRERWPVVARALLAGASGQLRNVATTGGNLMQRTRCVYFQDPALPCNKRQPGSGCPARDGFARYNAILGASDACVTVHPSDLCVALAAVGATVVVQGNAGERRIAFDDFHRLPGDDPTRDTVLTPDELITHVELPPLPAARRSTYRKVRDRASYAFALVSVAAAVDFDGPALRDVRVAFGGVAHKPWRARRAEALLRDGTASPEAFVAAIDAELADARPTSATRFKLPMLRNAFLDTMTRLCDRQAEPSPVTGRVEAMA